MEYAIKNYTGRLSLKGYFQSKPSLQSFISSIASRIHPLSASSSTYKKSSFIIKGVLSIGLSRGGVVLFHSCSVC
jgi:hypothetical protein